MRRFLFYMIFGFSFFFISTNESVSAASASIVDTTNRYSYEEMVKDIKALQKKYPELITYESIGKSEFNRTIYAVKIGKGEPTTLINGSHHAREWITTMINMKMIETYADSYYSKSLVGPYYTKDLLDELSIVFVPMVNPDGVTLQQVGLKAFPSSYHKTLLKMNDGKTDFSRWKANAKGIDLNRQYPANWYSKTDVTRPYYMNYKGSRPFEAKEVIALRDYTVKIKPKIAVAYHSSGRILYWHFHNKTENYSRDYRLASTFGDITDYRLIKPTSNPSGKGYTDWFIQQFGLPAYTPEVGYSVGETSVPVSVFPEEWRRNQTIGTWILAESYNLKYTAKKSIPFDEKVAFTENTYAYSQPSFLKREKTLFGPQRKVQALESFKNWYHVKTYTGDKWVYLPYDLATFPERIYLDIPKNHWAFSPTQLMKEKGWMNGITPTQFGVNQKVSREQVAVILVRALNLPLIDPEIASFTNVPKSHRLFSYIETAKAAGIFSPTEEGAAFGLGEPVTREQMAIIFAALSKKTPTIVEEHPYTDIDSTHPSYTQILLMKELGIFQGIDGAFKPNDTLTRGQLAKLLAKQGDGSLASF